MGGLKPRTDHLTFVGRELEGMGDFRKKKILQLTSREKKSCKEKCGKSILTQTKSPIQPAPMVDPLRRCLNIRRSYTLVETFFFQYCLSTFLTTCAHRTRNACVAAPLEDLQVKGQHIFLFCCN